MDSEKTIGVIGSNGLLGSNLVEFLGKKYKKIEGINRENYGSLRGKHYDILINANGNSKRFWANEHPLEDFEMSTISVYKSVFDFNFETYIYISSPDIYEDHSGPRSTEEKQVINPQKLFPYGFHKYLSELIVRRHARNYLILRPTAILGPGLKKGPIFDILSGGKLFVSLDSKIQMVTTEEIANVIGRLSELDVKNEIYNVGGRGAFLLRDIKKYAKDIVLPDGGTEKQMYEMNVEKLGAIYPLKTSDEYVEEFLLSGGNLISARAQL